MNPQTQSPFTPLRVGPLTLLLGLAGQRQTADYDYPEERVTLG